MQEATKSSELHIWSDWARISKLTTTPLDEPSNSHFKNVPHCDGGLYRCFLQCSQTHRQSEACYAPLQSMLGGRLQRRPPWNLSPVSICSTPPSDPPETSAHAHQESQFNCRSNCSWGIFAAQCTRTKPRHPSAGRTDLARPPLHPSIMGNTR